MSQKGLGGAFNVSGDFVPTLPVTQYRDFVSVLFAQYLGVSMQLQASLEVSFLCTQLDPRITRQVPDGVGAQASEQPISGLRTGASDTMYNAAPEPCGIPELGSSTVCAAPPSAGMSSTDMWSCERVHRCTGELVSHASPQPFGRSPLKSCLKTAAHRPAMFSASQPPRRVSFNFAVSFWFPSWSQLCLPPPTPNVQHVGSRCHSQSSFAAPSMCGVEQQSPYASSACDSAIDACNVLSLQDIPKTRHVVGCDNSSSCQAAQSCPDFLSHLPTCIPWLKPRAKSKDCRCQDVTTVADSGTSLSDFGGSAGVADVPQLHTAEHISVGLSADSSFVDPFTSFDMVLGERVLNGRLHWTEADYVREAIVTADLPGQPVGRALRFGTACHPSPQIILTQDHAGVYHRAVLFELTSIGGSLQVIDTVPGQTVITAIRDAAAVPDWQRLVGALQSGLIVCFVNRHTADAFTALPADADVVHLAPAASVDATVRSSTSPDCPTDVQGCGFTNLASDASSASGYLSPDRSPLFLAIGVDEGVVIRKQPVANDVQKCVLDALRSVARAGRPTGEVLKFPLERLPVPQVVMSRLSLWARSRTIVVDFRPVGWDIVALELPLGRPLQDLCVGEGALAAIFSREGLELSFLRAFIDHVPVSPMTLLDSHCQTLVFRPRSDPLLRGYEVCGDGHAHLDQESATGYDSSSCSTIDPRPPTPPISAKALRLSVHAGALALDGIIPAMLRCALLLLHFLRMLCPKPELYLMVRNSNLPSSIFTSIGGSLLAVLLSTYWTWYMWPWPTLPKSNVHGDTAFFARDGLTILARKSSFGGPFHPGTRSCQ